MSCARETVRGLGARAIRAADRAALAGEGRGHLGADDGASRMGSLSPRSGTVLARLRAADCGLRAPMESAARGGPGWSTPPAAPPVVRWSKPPLEN